MLDGRAPIPSSTRWCSSTRCSTARRCCQAIELARLARAPALDRRRAREAPERHTGLESRRGPGRPVHARRTPPSVFSYDNERPRHGARRAGLPHRPHADHQRHVPDASSRAAATSAASGGRTRAGPGSSATTSPTRALGGGPVRVAAVAHRRGGRRSTPTSPSSTSPGSRPTPLPGHTPLAFLPRENGRRRRPGTRNGHRPGRFPWGGEPPQAADGRANLDQHALGPRPAGALPAGAAPVARSGCSATSGSGRRATSTATPASSRTRTASTPRSSSARDYKVLRGGSWATRAARRDADVPQLGPAAAPPDLLRVQAGMGRVAADATPDRLPRRRGHAALAARRRARRPDAPV